MRAQWFWAVFLLAGFSATVNAQALRPSCDGPEWAEVRDASVDELKTRGISAEPVLTVPYGSVVAFDFRLTYAVGETGRVECLSVAGSLGRSFEWTAERQAYLTRLAQTVYQPFLSEQGAPQTVRISQYVTEEEQPRYHIQPPDGAPAAAAITITRNDHHNDPFTMTVSGDGKVLYQPLRGDGVGFFFGPQAYEIPRQDVARIIEAAKAADFWSARDRYYPAGMSFDTEGYSAFYDDIVISLGGRTKRVRNYGAAGAPVALDALLDTSVELAGADVWSRLDETTLDALAKNRFDFTSRRACDLLQYAAGNGNYSDAIVLSLVDRGTSPTCIGADDSIVGLDRSLIDSAILARRDELVVALIAKGALLTKGKPDPTRASRALAYAAAAGAPELVDRLLADRPPLTITYRNRLDNLRITDPVIVFVGRASRTAPDDEKRLIQVTLSLVAAGADLHSYDARGKNLLIHALENSQIEFARWLLSQDVKPRFADGDVAWFITNDEEVTVLMLEAGAADDPEILADVTANARLNSQSRVTAWLKAHGKWKE